MRKVGGPPVSHLSIETSCKCSLRACKSGVSVLILLSRRFHARTNREIVLAERYFQPEMSLCFVHLPSSFTVRGCLHESRSLVETVQRDTEQKEASARLNKSISLRFLRDHGLLIRDYFILSVLRTYIRRERERERDRLSSLLASSPLYTTNYQRFMLASCLRAAYNRLGQLFSISSVVYTGS